MSRVVVNSETLSSIADAIREKTGATDKYKPAEMADAIASIESGGIDSEIIANLSRKHLTNEQAQIMLATIANNSSSIGDYLFHGQYDITSITIPDNIDFYSSSCFDCCFNLATVNLSPITRSIASNAFAHTAIETITFPSTLKSMDIRAFGYCNNLKTVYFEGIPNGINSYAFQYSENITDIYVPWSEGAVANAPWGAENATIHYNYIEEV